MIYGPDAHPATSDAYWRAGRADAGLCGDLMLLHHGQRRPGPALGLRRAKVPDADRRVSRSTHGVGGWAATGVILSACYALVALRGGRLGDLIKGKASKSITDMTGRKRGDLSRRSSSWTPSSGRLPEPCDRYHRPPRSRRSVTPDTTRRSPSIRQIAKIAASTEVSRYRSDLAHPDPRDRPRDAVLPWARCWGAVYNLQGRTCP